MNRQKWISVMLAAAMLLGGCAAKEQFAPLETISDEIPAETADSEEKGDIIETETEKAVETEDGLVEEPTPEGTRPVPEQTSEDYVLIDMENIEQNPELPTGCESVALTIVLNYFGFNLDKTTIADEYLIFTEENFAEGYMGDPHTDAGAGVFPPGLVNTADRFLVENGSEKRAFDISDTEFEDLYNYVADGIPVIVWNTMYLEEPIPTDEICEYEGRQYRWFRNEHCVVLCGFDRETDKVFIQDPLDGFVERDADTFEEYYNTIGEYAMIIH